MWPLMYHQQHLHFTTHRQLQLPHRLNPGTLVRILLYILQLLERNPHKQKHGLQCRKAWCDEGAHHEEISLVGFGNGSFGAVQQQSNVLNATVELVMASEPEEGLLQESIKCSLGRKASSVWTTRGTSKMIRIAQNVWVIRISPKMGILKESPKRSEDLNDSDVYKQGEKQRQVEKNGACVHTRNESRVTLPSDVQPSNFHLWDPKS